VTSLFFPIILINRGFWIAIATGVLLFSYSRFSFKQRSRKPRKKKQVAPTSKPVVAPALVTTRGVFTGQTAWQQFVSFFKMNVLNIVKSTTFVILFTFATILLLVSMLEGFEYFGLQSYPVTYKMIDQIEGSTSLFILIITIFFSGEIVWRDRGNHIDEVINATPHSSFTSMLAKTLSLITVPVLMYLFFVLLSILYQLSTGYTRIDLSQYLLNFLYTSIPLYFSWSAVFILVQVLVSNRYVGYFLSILLLMAIDVLLTVFEVSSNMLSISEGPSLRYSDMNGFGPGLKGAMWFNLYWVLFGCILLYLAGLFWPRGKGKMKERFGLVKKAFRGKTALGFAGLFAVWLAVAGFVYYNTQGAQRVSQRRRVRSTCCRVREDL
jgi:hypothetical protein